MDKTRTAGWWRWAALTTLLSTGACASEGSDPGQSAGQNADPNGGQSAAPSGGQSASPSGGQSAGHSDGQSGTEGGQLVCTTAVSQRPLAPDEVVDGSSVLQFMEQLGGERELPVSWDCAPPEVRGGPGTHDTRGRFELTADPSSARLVDYGPSCFHSLELNATLRFRTVDGAFSGTLPGTLSGGGEQGFGFKAELPVEQVRGSFQSPPACDELVSPSFVEFADWQADPPLVYPVKALKLTHFELERGSDIAWRTGVRDAGTDAPQDGDESTSLTSTIVGMDAGTER
jgi:hypothetical protein